VSHIHLPDGVLSPVFWVPGFIICFALLWFFTKRIKGEEAKKKIPLTGVAAGLMLIFMSVPLGFLPVHLGLAVLCGILVGPALGFTAAFAVNTILALLGHGGFTVIGINTLLMGGEAVLGCYIFRALSRRTGKTSSAVISNIIALLITTALMVLIVSSAVGAAHALPIHDHGHEIEAAHGAEDFSFLTFTGWSAAAIIIAAGILIESFATGLIVRFLSKIRPDLIH
jgi:cobalt/nickel transport system permease protein